MKKILLGLLLAAGTAHGAALVPACDPDIVRVCNVLPATSSGPWIDNGTDVYLSTPTESVTVESTLTVRGTDAGGYSVRAASGIVTDLGTIRAPLIVGATGQFAYVYASTFVAQGSAFIVGQTTIQATQAVFGGKVDIRGPTTIANSTLTVGGRLFSVGGTDLSLGNSVFGSGTEVLGIGTSNPLDNAGGYPGLVIKDNAHTVLFTEDGNAACNLWAQAGVNKWSVCSETPGPGNMRWYNYDKPGTFMLWDNAGDIGIGPGAPQYRLDVSSTIHGVTGVFDTAVYASSFIAVGSAFIAGPTAIHDNTALFGGDLSAMSDIHAFGELRANGKVYAGTGFVGDGANITNLPAGTLSNTSTYSVAGLNIGTMTALGNLFNPPLLTVGYSSTQPFANTNISFMAKGGDVSEEILDTDSLNSAAWGVIGGRALFGGLTAPVDIVSGGTPILSVDTVAATINLLAPTQILSNTYFTTATAFSVLGPTLTVLTSGAVGLGTALPDAKLHISGSGFGIGDDGAAILKLTAPNGESSGGPAQLIIQNSSVGGGDQLFDWLMYEDDDGALNLGNQIGNFGSFNPLVISATNYIVITQASIGTGNKPRAVLDVGNGQADIPPALLFNVGGGSLSVQQSGRVGIGTSNPAAKLHISTGGAIIDGTGTDGLTIQEDGLSGSAVNVKLNSTPLVTIGGNPPVVSVVPGQGFFRAGNRQGCGGVDYAEYDSQTGLGLAGGGGQLALCSNNTMILRTGLNDTYTSVWFNPQLGDDKRPAAQVQISSSSNPSGVSLLVDGDAPTPFKIGGGSMTVDSGGNLSLISTATIGGLVRIGFQQTTNACVGLVTSCNVSCPAGTVLTGGGCNAGAVGLAQDSPDAGNSLTQWDCTSLGLTNITAYAFCGRFAQ